jgi:hypothetical protein
MADDFSFENEVLYKSGKRYLLLPNAIQKLVVLADSIVILVAYSSIVGNQNVFCYDYDKHLLWQIPPPVEFHDENYFTGLYLTNDKLYAYNKNGVEYHLDKQTGKILDSQLIR